LFAKPFASPFYGGFQYLLCKVFCHNHTEPQYLPL
jgi:hypothetical protein